MSCKVTILPLNESCLEWANFVKSYVGADEIDEDFSTPISIKFTKLLENINSEIIIIGNNEVDNYDYRYLRFMGDRVEEKIVSLKKVYLRDKKINSILNKKL
jgi:hypothetical protein